MNAERRPSFAEIVLSLEGLEREEGEEEKEEEHIALGKQNKTWEPTTLHFADPPFACRWVQ